MDPYQLVFEDHFTVDGKPNPHYYNFEVGKKWHNNELQCYTDSPTNCFVKDHCLHIKATLEKGDCKYQSARINTKQKLSWQYGRFVIRAKLPKGHGSWPALWFLGTNQLTKTPWPLCGEIDLMEQSGHTPNQIVWSLHTQTFNHTAPKAKQRSYSETILGVTEGFHDYEMIWTPRSIVFLVDQVKRVEYLRQPGDTVNEWPFDQPFYLIMNVAVGGSMGGPVVDQELPFEMLVDSIQVYQIKS